MADVPTLDNDAVQPNTAVGDAIAMIEKWHEDEQRFKDALKLIKHYIQQLEFDNDVHRLTIKYQEELLKDATLVNPEATIPLLTDLDDKLIDQETGKPVSLIVANPEGKVWSVSSIVLTDDTFTAKEIVVN